MQNIQLYFVCWRDPESWSWVFPSLWCKFRKRNYYQNMTKLAVVFLIISPKLVYVLKVSSKIFPPTKFESKIVLLLFYHCLQKTSFASPHWNLKSWFPLFLWFSHWFIIFKFLPTENFQPTYNWLQTDYKPLCCKL